MASLPSLDETIDFMDRMAGLYTVAELARAAGISGATGLKTSVVEFLAEVTGTRGLDVLPAYATESGFAAVALQYTLRAGTWLRGAVPGLLAWISKNPGMVIGGLLVGGGAVGAGVLSYKAYTWLTGAEQTEGDRLSQVGQVLEHAIDGMTPEERARAFATLAAQLGPQPQRMNWFTIGLVALGGYVVYRALGDRR